MFSIKSLQHPLVKHLVKLREKASYRYETQKVLIYGKKCIRELAPLFPIRTVLVEQELFVPAEKTYLVTKDILKKVGGEMFDAIAEIDMPPFQDLSQKKKLIILDAVQDPGNPGTILRTACGLGFEGAFLTSGCADPFNDKAIRAAKGSTFYLPLASGPLSDLSFSGTFFAADPVGTPLKEVSFTPPFALIFGNEGHGLSTQAIKMSKKIAIPLSSQIESLNVAAAAAIILYYASDA